jgi:hypothetical protein
MDDLKALDTADLLHRAYHLAKHIQDAEGEGPQHTVVFRSGDRKEGRRHSTTDEGRLQSAHDLLVELGAKCTEADEAKREEPSGAKREELPSPASLRLLTEWEVLELT